MKKKKQSKSGNEDSISSSKNKSSSLHSLTSSSSTHTSREDKDDGTKVLKKKRKSSRKSMKLTSIDQSIKPPSDKVTKSSSDSTLNNFLSPRKIKSKSVSSPKRTLKKDQSSEISSLKSHLNILQEKYNTLESILMEEKSNRLLFQSVIQKQDELISNLKMKIESQDRMILELMSEFKKFKDSNLKKESKTKRKSSKRKDSKINEEKDKKSEIKEYEDRKARAFSSPILPNHLDIKESTRNLILKGSGDSDKSNDINYFNDNVQSTGLTHYAWIKVNNNNDKKLSKKRSQDRYQHIRTYTPPPENSSSKEDGYTSEGSTSSHYKIKHKRSSDTRIHNIQSVNIPYPRSNTPTNKSVSPEPKITRIPSPYILFPDHIRDELKDSAPTPRSLAAAISNFHLTSVGVPVILEQWTNTILNEGYHIHDLFTKKVKVHSPKESVHYEDCYQVAAALKHWFMDLPDSIFMTSKYQHWASAIQIEDETRISYLRTLFFSLEETNRTLLLFMIKFFHKLLNIENCAISKESIAVTFGPIFLRGVKPVYTTRIGVTFGDIVEQKSKKNEELKSHEEISISLLNILLDESSIFESDNKHITFEKIGRNFVVTSATFENLLLLLIDTNYTEREFNNIFWSTCKYFKSYSEILKALIDIYNRYHGESKWKANIRMRVLMTIKNWTKGFSDVLNQDSLFKEILYNFINNKDEKKYSKENQVIQSISNSLSAESPIKLLPIRQVVKPNNLIIEQYDQKTFAIQLLLMHSEIMPYIEYKELFNVGTKDKKDVSNYSTVIDFINNLTMWVAHDILSHNNVNGRVRALSYYINVANQSVQLHDYNGAWAIFGAIGLHIIQRLTTTWEKLPKKDLALFKKLEALFEPRLNFAEYRRRYESSIKEHGYAIPVLALISMDIIRYQVEPTYLDNGKIHFSKMRKIYTTYQYLSKSNITPLNSSLQEYQKVDKLWNWLWNYKDVDEVQLEEMSNRYDSKVH